MIDWERATEQETRIDEIKAIRELREVVRLDPDRLDAYRELAARCESANRWGEAAAAWIEAIRLAPDDPKLHWSLGVCLGEGGRRDERVAAHREAIRLDPNDDETRGWLGQALDEMGRKDEAITVFQEMIQRAPLDASLSDLNPDVPAWAIGYCYLGLLLNETGQLAPLIAHLREVVRPAPGSGS